MLVPVLKGYGEFIAAQGGGHHFKEVGWIYEKGTGYLSYRRDSFDRGINFLRDKIIKDPSWAAAANKDIIFYTEKYFKFAKKLEKEDFSKYTKKRLAKAFLDLMEHQRLSHISGQMTTWLIDAEQQLFTKYLLDFLNKRIKDLKLKIEAPVVFPVLTVRKERAWSNARPGRLWPSLY